MEIFFSVLWVFDCLDQDRRQLFGVRHCKILCHASFCVGVVYTQQLLIICGQLYMLVSVSSESSELVLSELT